MIIKYKCIIVLLLRFKNTDKKDSIVCSIVSLKLEHNRVKSETRVRVFPSLSDTYLDPTL